ncbi:MAG: GIY-YIG nuclease family protein [Chloroflexi bacterium]|nr:GIY-YIG nuclease family protein [Chloroflexota bacterium]
MNDYRQGTMYVGVTNNLERRVQEHKQKVADGFTKEYGLTRLVYFEHTGEAMSAIEREKQIKGWLRRRKIELIESMNPNWRDLSTEWEQTAQRDNVDSPSLSYPRTARGREIQRDSSLRSE